MWHFFEQIVPLRLFRVPCGALVKLERNLKFLYMVLASGCNAFFFVVIVEYIAGIDENGAE